MDNKSNDKIQDTNKYIAYKVVRGVSKKTGFEYVRVDVTFPNGYVKSIFLDGKEVWILKEYIG
jgi:hypothetical protein